MKSKVFKNGSKGDTREILIVISEDFAEFFYNEYYHRHNEWLAEQEESGNIENIDEDAKDNNGFYWIGRDDWNFRQQEWITHLSRKNWVTGDMLAYLHDNLSVKK